MAYFFGSKIKADLVLGSDPDCDRIGSCGENTTKSFKCLTGKNTVVFLEYRLSVAREKMFFPKVKNVAILKTFVTTPLISNVQENWCSCKSHRF